MKDKFQALFKRMWERSDKIFGVLTGEGFYTSPIKYRYPFIFYLGHLPAFCWNQLCDGVLQWKSLNPDYDLLFERGIDPPVDIDFQPNETELWPTVEDVISYRDKVRASIFDGIEEVDRLSKVTKGDPLIENGRILHVVLEHELMHHETLLYMLCQLDFDKKLKPLDLPLPVLGKNAVNSLVRIDGRGVRLGIDFEAVEFGWDNEFGQQWVDVKSFDIDRYPVSNAEFLQFLQNGGYRDSRFWDADSWQWKSREKI
ncbi:MAG: DinB family protein, partial [Blastocatellia bacterium]|nr:DinB family protein [Blastocatellia bacterium]